MALLFFFANLSAPYIAKADNNIRRNDMIGFILKSAATYMVGKIAVGTAENIYNRYVKKSEQPGYYTNVIGFEVDPGEVYIDDSDKGEFIVKGFVVE